MKKDKLLAIGEALIDMAPGEVGCDFAHVTSFYPAVGGAPANVAAAYSKLGGRAQLLSALGCDPFGDKIIETLSEVGVDVSRVVRTDKANTALAFVSLDREGGRTFSFYRNPSADMLYTGEELEPSLFADAFALTYCTVSLGDFPMKEAHRRAIRLAKESNTICVFDPNLRFPLWKSREALSLAVKEFLPTADILKISDEELSFITGCDTVEAALPALFASGTSIVLYTCGKRGGYAFTANGASAYAKGTEVRAVDTTGAGDAALSSFLFALMRAGAARDTLSDISEEQLARALSFSVAYSGLTVTKHGAIPSYPGADAISV